MRNHHSPFKTVVDIQKRPLSEEAVKIPRAHIREQRAVVDAFQIVGERIDDGVADPPELFRVHRYPLRRSTRNAMSFENGGDSTSVTPPSEATFPRLTVLPDFVSTHSAS